MSDDLFDDATHRELDRMVNEVTERRLGNVSDLSSILHHFCLLFAIIKHSNDVLDKKYTDIDDAAELLDTHEDLRTMLASAWKQKSYRKIRNLAILKAPTATAGPAKLLVTAETDSERPRIRVAEGLSGSFEKRYYGFAVEGFYEYLTYNEGLFRKPFTRYYAKFCSIVQSSGTGKSRMLTELRQKNVIVVYMNLREEEDVVGFPGRDPIPSAILTNFPSPVDAYQTVCYAFLTALFDTLLESLPSNQTTPRVKAIIEWVDEMCDMNYHTKSTTRPDFFRKLARNYFKIHSGLVQYLHPLPLSERQAYPLAHSHLTAVLTEAYKRVGAHLADIFPDRDALCEPKLVIAFDEAHTLCSPGPGASYRAADVLFRAVNDYTHSENHAIWVVFASTTVNVADFPLPNWKYNSTSVALRGDRLFPPYSQLGWDQFATPLGGVDPEDVARLDHIIGYGRPLWVSLKTAHGLAHKVLSIASSKLYGSRPLKPYDINHVLAILGQRFNLNLMLGHRDSLTHLEKGVASHLRVCLATTIDRNWKFTSYPSEPLLSCVAANDLHKGRKTLGFVMGTLLNIVNCGMIDIGQRAELASQLLWLLGKDLFIRTTAKNVVTQMPDTWDGHLVDCQMIPVVDWLEFMFGPQAWGKGTTEGSIARKTFKDAYLNFSHWVCMNENIAGTKDEDEISLDEWTLRHWQRTSGVQCCPQQPLIDKMIPIFFKGKPVTMPAESRVSQILISDEVLEPKHSERALAKITPRSEHLRGEMHESTPLPYIAIVADLFQPTSFSATFHGQDVDNQCLRIYAGGINTSTYPFLADYPELKQALEHLVHLQRISKTQRFYTDYVGSQMKFGETAAPDYMEWERGQTVPTP